MAPAGHYETPRRKLSGKQLSHPEPTSRDQVTQALPSHHATALPSPGMLSPREDLPKGHIAGKKLGFTLGPMGERKGSVLEEESAPKGRKFPQLQNSQEPTKAQEASPGIPLCHQAFERCLPLSKSKEKLPANNYFLKNSVFLITLLGGNGMVIKVWRQTTLSGESEVYINGAQEETFVSRWSGESLAVSS